MHARLKTYLPPWMQEWLDVIVPLLQIALIVLATYFFSLLTTIVPAWQAARIYPAEALRYE